MNDIKKLLQEANLPELTDRESMKKMLLDKEYGYVPDIPYKVEISEPKVMEARFCCGTAATSKVEFTITTELGSHTFPVFRLLHDDGKKHPFFVFMGFSSAVPNNYFPVEEIADRGYDVLMFNYDEVSLDFARVDGKPIPGDFSNGIAGILLPNGRDRGDVCGKIALWAWTASRVLDYAETLPQLDMAQAAVVGHSRLGKTALVAGMMDERFRYVFSNDSGCSGAALARGSLGVMGRTGKYGKTGETIRVVNENFPHWFCENYRAYNETNIPEDFDQHFLLATIAPRFVYVASGAMDDWASPDSEFLCCAAASEMYARMGLTGFVCGGYLPDDDVTWPAGRIGYHRRPGKHFLSRTDWNRYMDFIALHHDDQ